MTRKIKAIGISVLSVIAGGYLLFYLLLNFYFIPKVIFPKVNTFIENNIIDPVRLSVSDISYHPIKGFQLEDVLLTGPVLLENNTILKAKNIDIDLAFWPLFIRRVKIMRLEFESAHLSIGRSSEGEWNFQPVLDLDFLKESDVSKTDFKVIVERVELIDCSLGYEDALQKDNKIQKSFTDIRISLTRPEEDVHRVHLSGGGKDIEKERVRLNFDFNRKKKSSKGSFTFTTMYLGKYWDYFLDDLMHPWNLTADAVNVEASFSHDENTITLDGSYSINGAVLKYGDLSINGNIRGTQEIRYIRGKPNETVADIDVYFDDVVSKAGRSVLLHKGECIAQISNKGVTISKLSGMIAGKPLEFTGQFDFGEPDKFYLKGKIADIENEFNLVIETNNTGSATWQSKLGNSVFNINANVTDLEDFVFDMNLDADLKAPDILSLFGTRTENIRGVVDFSGTLNGEIDEPSSLNGELIINVKDFAIKNIKPQTFKYKAEIREGVLDGNIPEHKFYNGKYFGQMKMDFERVGAQINISGLSIEKAFEEYPDLTGLKGKFDGSIACISEWQNVSSVKGGGFFSFINCNLWDAPIFKQTEEDIENASSQISFPEKINKLEGNFGIKEKEISIENVYCKAKKMRLQIKGNYKFSGETEATVGVSFSEAGPLRTVRQVILPVSIGVDLLANSFQINLRGQWPDLDSSLQIQPIQWFNAIFPSMSRAKPEKYTLAELWDNMADDHIVNTNKGAGNSKRRNSIGGR